MKKKKTRKGDTMNIRDLLDKAVSQQDYLNFNNINIVYEELPEKINGFVFNYDDRHFVIIDNNLSYYMKRKTILHELAHIELNQLNQIDKDLFAFKVNKYEDDADIYLKIIMESLK